MNDRILVTGGAGFIGSHLVDHLLSMGYRVVVIDNLANGKEENLYQAAKDKKFVFYKGDILSKADCAYVSKDIDIVFHLACLGVRHSLHSPFENHRVNAEGTLNVLEAARKNNAKHFVYISTSEIYGRTNDFPIHERSQTNPLTVYGSSKLAGEHYTHSYRECFGLHSTVLRIFNNYGPRAHYEGDAGEVIPRSIVRILNNVQPVIFGSGSITRDFFYVKDTARCLATLIPKLNELDGETINIGTGVEITMKGLILQLLRALGKESLGIKYLEERPADVPRLWVDNSKFRKMIAYQPQYSFVDGIQETVRFYEELSRSKHLIDEIEDTNWRIKTEL